MFIGLEQIVAQSYNFLHILYFLLNAMYQKIVIKTENTNPLFFCLLTNKDAIENMHKIVLICS